MKHIHFSALALVVMLSLQTVVGANPTGWFFNGSQEPAWGPAGDRNPNNATVTYVNGVMKIVANGGNYYPQFNFPSTDITANPVFKIKYKCTSNDYIFIKLEPIKPSNIWWCHPDAVKVVEINSEGVWSTKEITLTGNATYPYLLDDINNLTVSFRTGSGSFAACTVEIDEMSIGTVSTGINQPKLANLSLYPSMVKSELNITSEAGKNAMVEIFNLAGTKVMATNIAQFNGKSVLNVANLNAGSYILNLTIDGKKATQRFVKQ